MEVNKDEALRCVEIAKNAQKQGDYERALKFLKKSLQLYPTGEAQQCLAAIEAKLKHASTNSNNNSSTHSHSNNNNNSSSSSSYTRVHRETTTTTTSSSDGTQRTFTKEQKEIVDRIRKAKDYYEILHVEKTATTEQIKKSYKKLALQMHPDKNPAPGADEAFKKVGQAFACLSDEKRRSMYDVQGHDEPERPTVSNMRREYDSDLTPEEIFMAFFGGVPLHQRRRAQGSSPFRTHVYTTGFDSDHVFRRRTASARTHTNAHTHAENDTNSSTIFTLFQLLPLLVLFYFTFMSSPSEPLFSLQKGNKFVVEMQTTNGIPYFVKRDFAERVNARDARRIEEEVVGTWVQHMRDECHYEQLQKQKLHKAAYYNEGSEYGKKMREKAMNFQTPSCDQLTAKGFKLR